MARTKTEPKTPHREAACTFENSGTKSEIWANHMDDSCNLLYLTIFLCLFVMDTTKTYLLFLLNWSLVLIYSFNYTCNNFLCLFEYAYWLCLIVQHFNIVYDASYKDKHASPGPEPGVPAGARDPYGFFRCKVSFWNKNQFFINGS